MGVANIVSHKTHVDRSYLVSILDQRVSQGQATISFCLWAVKFSIILAPRKRKTTRLCGAIAVTFLFNLAIAT